MFDSSLFEIIHGRRAVRNYKPNVKIPENEIAEMLQEATRAPSGGNLQSWRFLVLDSLEQKQKLFSIAYNQKQVVEASAVIVVLGDLECYKMAKKIYNQAVEAGVMPEDVAKFSIGRYTDLYSNMSQEDVLQNVSLECGLVSMQFMLVARAKGYDTGPMRGFSKEQLMKAFNIGDRYTPVLLIALGESAKAGYPTVRLPIESITFFNEIHKN
ncbi:nitroreductase family protein [Ethanoligenens harbinense]|uniref:Nitroreductase n=1 Tax=Ethanoligenens harbinense (strain DSM 18485 / JCM 12961 / CGMCC 1.5033 / YUAN-3) TaxID=663278 RepID=E6U3T3_ETHHY|nr:nitroreductase family protein [Ethanoligenens harbinense]ADU26500.1 nitroreductase [Ethanoligenens harbinense YUAN-3]AVQ95625.1 nitroreductase family protein [Ethanoligenens harbinense YUAN-3]AYF38289.1 nitroreductase family protein [Ethanoligenens harbinense]AYF41035.1 nitroreductase family protein [Ethanoligenens harbinense]QCN91866.1 nitroreductase family protein [Ethanoligenens harbinense]